jgi:hypothetical protein
MQLNITYKYTYNKEATHPDTAHENFISLGELL